MESRIDTLKDLISATTSQQASHDAEVERLMFDAAANTLLGSRTSRDALRYVEKTLSLKALTNLADTEVRCRFLLEQHKPVVVFCLSELTRMSKLVGVDSNQWQVLVNFLANVTRWEFWVETISQMSNEEFDFDCVLANLQGTRLQQLLPLILNLSQASAVRKLLCRAPHFRLAALLPFLERKQSAETRKLAAGIVKNVCFEDDCHAALVSSEAVDGLAAILRALVRFGDAGEGGIDDEDFQDLPPIVRDALTEASREREPEEEVRLRLVRALLQLCATPIGREALVDSNTYVVLRELYKWENEHGSRTVLLEVQHVIDVLITETEPNPEQVVPDYDRSANFRHVTVTEEDVKLVERVDEEFLQK